MSSYIVFLCKPGEHSAYLKHIVRAASLAAACEVATAIAKNGHHCIWRDGSRNLAINKWRRGVGVCAGDSPLEVLSIQKATSL